MTFTLTSLRPGRKHWSFSHDSLPYLVMHRNLDSGRLHLSAHFAQTARQRDVLWHPQQHSHQCHFVNAAGFREGNWVCCCPLILWKNKAKVTYIIYIKCKNFMNLKPPRAKPWWQIVKKEAVAKWALERSL